MALVTKNNTFSTGATIVAAEHNENFDTIYNDYNGNITNANISGSASIADSKLAQITTASKVSTSAITDALGLIAITGEVKGWVTDTAPTGWLLCDGSAVSRTTYSDLFGVISTQFGNGNGTTTFNVPDLRGRSIVGTDDMGGSSANRITAAWADTIGGSGGLEDHTLTSDEMPAHTHTLTGRNNSNAGTVPATREASGDSTANATSSTGGGSAHNNIQPSVALNYIIKT